MVLRYYYILELTTIIADGIDIQGDSLQEFIGYYQVEEWNYYTFVLYIFMKPTFLCVS